MKKSFLLVLATFILLLTSCSNSQTQSIESSTPAGESRQEFSDNTHNVSDESNPEASTSELPYIELPVQPDNFNYSSLKKVNVKNLISVGCSYQAPENTRSDTWADNGVRLTDGIKAPVNGESPEYSGFALEQADFILDLGQSDILSALEVSLCSGDWGIEEPQKVVFCSSEDNINWTFHKEVSVDNAAVYSGTDKWSKYIFSCDFGNDSNISARYIKCTVFGTNHIWIDEISAYGYIQSYFLFVNAIDGLKILTPSPDGKAPSFLGEGQGAIVTDMYGKSLPALTRSRIAIFAPDKTTGEYVITDIIITNGNENPAFTIPFEGFAYIVNTGNNWPELVKQYPDKYSFATDYPNYMSEEITQSYYLLEKLEVGMRVNLFQINLIYGTISDGFGSGISISETLD